MFYQKSAWRVGSPWGVLDPQNVMFGIIISTLFEELYIFSAIIFLLCFSALNFGPKSNHFAPTVCINDKISIISENNEIIYIFLISFPCIFLKSRINAHSKMSNEES